MDTIRRGYIPKDTVEFGPKAAETLAAAAQELAFLMNRGYDTKSASTFIGNHHHHFGGGTVRLPADRGYGQHHPGHGRTAGLLSHRRQNCAGSGPSAVPAGRARCERSAVLSGSAGIQFRTATGDVAEQGLDTFRQPPGGTASQCGWPALTHGTGRHGGRHHSG